MKTLETVGVLATVIGAIAAVLGLLKQGKERRIQIATAGDKGQAASGDVTASEGSTAYGHGTTVNQNQYNINALNNPQAQERQHRMALVNEFHSSGGKGGNAEVVGHGTAIGGPGGYGGKYGIGGDGGSAVVHGDGLAAGGAGGAGGDNTIWRAPAKSGYEVTQRRLGLPVDSFIRQFGRGGAVPGYEPKLALIEQLRASYFQDYSKKTETIFENINAVPLDYLNSQLATKNDVWRVRIVDDEYEFFVPEQ
jgi:hypothetical protein